MNPIRYFLVVVFTALYLPGYGQKIKVGFRTGISFGNFYAHHSPSERPRFPSEMDPNELPPILRPAADQPPPSYYYETSLGKDMRSGIFSHLFMEWELEKRLSAEMGLGYSQKGIDMKYSMYSTSINSDNATTKLSYQFNRNLRLDYIVIPVNFLYKLGRKERFYVLAGIYHSIATNFLIKTSLIAIEEQTFDSSGQLKTHAVSNSMHKDAYASIFDSGLVGGFGVNFPLTKKLMLGMDIRSAVGIISIPRKYEEYGFQGFNQTTKNINFETGLKLLYLLK